MKWIDRLKICWSILHSNSILYLGDSESHIDPDFLDLGSNSEDYGSCFFVERIESDFYALVYTYKYYEKPEDYKIPIKYFRYIIAKGHYEECRDIACALNKLITTRSQH